MTDRLAEIRAEAAVGSSYSGGFGKESMRLVLARLAACEKSRNAWKDVAHSNAQDWAAADARLAACEQECDEWERVANMLKDTQDARLAIRGKALRQIARMAGAAGAGETPAMPIAKIARDALAAIEEKPDKTVSSPPVAKTTGNPVAETPE